MSSATGSPCCCAVAIRLPENTNATAGNGGESQSYKAAGLASIIQPTSDSGLRFEDRHAAWLAGVEKGRAERVDIEVEDRARELLHDWALESLHLAQQFAAAKGPAWAQMFTG